MLPTDTWEGPAALSPRGRGWRVGPGALLQQQVEKATVLEVAPPGDAPVLEGARSPGGAFCRAHAQPGGEGVTTSASLSCLVPEIPGPMACLISVHDHLRDGQETK